MILQKQDIGRSMVERAIDEIREAFSTLQGENYKPYIALDEDGITILYPQPDHMIVILSRTQYDVLKKYSINRITFSNEHIVINPAQGWRQDIEVRCKIVEVSGALNIKLKAESVVVHYDIWGSTIKAKKVEFRLDEETHIVFKNSQLICDKLVVFVFDSVQIRWFKMMYKKDRNKLSGLFGDQIGSKIVCCFEKQKYKKYALNTSH